MHLPTDLLALLALGEDAGTADDLRHLAGCPECRTELSALRHVVAVGRSLDPEGELVAPAPHVWDGVLAATAGGPTGQVGAPDPADPAGQVGEPDPAEQDAADHRAGSDLPVADRPSRTDPERRYADYLRPVRKQQGPGWVWPPQPPPRRRPVLTSAVAAVALVLGLGLGLGWERITEPAVREVARTELSPVGPLPAEGVARLQQTEDGVRELVVDLTEAVPVDGELQVWLVAPDLVDMTHLGALVGSQGRWVVPPDVVLADRPLVDVSIEPPADGDPKHSGRSLLRGELPA